MLTRIRKSLKNEKGFTILELIVVIAIMGFLIALVAPKLSDVTENSHGNISLTNLQRLNEAVGRYVADNGKLPNKLGNGTWLKRTEADGTWDITPHNAALTTVKATGNAGSSIVADPNEKLYSLYSPNFTRRHGIVLHDITKKEAEEIKKMGINTIIDYETNKEIPVKEGCRVMMIGTGGGGNVKEQIGSGRPRVYDVKYRYDTSKPKDMAYVSPSKSAAQGIPQTSLSKYLMHKKNHSYKGNYSGGFDLGRLARPELVYRIVLAIGEDSDIAKKGYLKNIGMDPAVVDIKQYVQMTEYGLVLPRLQATLDRLDTPTMPAKIKVNGYDKDGKSTGQQKTVDVSKSQTIDDITILGQGEVVYPISDVYEWEVDTIFDKDDKLIEHEK